MSLCCIALLEQCKMRREALLRDRDHPDPRAFNRSSHSHNLLNNQSTCGALQEEREEHELHRAELEAAMVTNSGKCTSGEPKSVFLSSRCRRSGRSVSCAARRWRQTR